MSQETTSHRPRKVRGVVTRAARAAAETAAAARVEVAARAKAAEEEVSRAQAAMVKGVLDVLEADVLEEALLPHRSNGRILAEMWG